MKTTRCLLLLAVIGAASLNSFGQSPGDFQIAGEIPVQSESEILAINAGPVTLTNKVTIADVKKLIADYEGKSPEPTLDLSGALPPVVLPQAQPAPPQIVYLPAPQSSAEAWQAKAIGWITAAGFVLGTAATVILGFLMKYGGQIKEVKERLTRQDTRQNSTAEQINALALAVPPPVPINATDQNKAEALAKALTDTVQTQVDQSRKGGLLIIGALLLIAMGTTGCAEYKEFARGYDRTYSVRYGDAQGRTGEAGITPHPLYAGLKK